LGYQSTKRGHSEMVSARNRNINLEVSAAGRAAGDAMPLKKGSVLAVNKTDMALGLGLAQLALEILVFIWLANGGPNDMGPHSAGKEPTS